MTQQYCLKWKYHQDNLQNMFSQLLDRGCFCDVTIACEGQTLRAHRVVLCACSTYFEAILSHNHFDSKDPIILMRDCRFEDIRCLIEFMYKGEINVDHDNLPSLMRTATELCIKGLADMSYIPDSDVKPSGGSPSHTMQPHQPPHHQNTRQAVANQQRHAENANRAIPNSNHQHSNNSTNHNHNPIDQNGLLTPMSRIPSHISSSALLSAAFSMTASGAVNSRSHPHPLYHPMQPHRLELRSEALSSAAGAVGPPPPKRKRGRPPLDAEFDCYSTPRIAHVECGVAPLDADPFADMPSTTTTTTSVGTAGFDDGDNDGNSCGAASSSSVKPMVKAMLEDGGSRGTPSDDDVKAAAGGAATAAYDDDAGSPAGRVEEVNVQENLVSDNGSDGADATRTHRQRPGSDTDDGHSQESQPHQPPDRQHQQPQHPAEHPDHPAAGGSQMSRSSWDDSAMQMECDAEDMMAGRLIPKIERPETPTEYDDGDDPEQQRLQRQLHQHMMQQRQQQMQMLQMKQDAALARELEERKGSRFMPLRGNSQQQSLSPSPMGGESSHNSSIDCLTAQEMLEWGDVVKLSDYLRNGRRPHFWEEPFTVRIMDAIKNKALEMKKGAMLLGVSYGTLYGRYRETYGCLKHSFRSFWHRREINGNNYDFMSPINGGQFAATIERVDRPEASVSPQPPQQLQQHPQSQSSISTRSISGTDEIVVSYLSPKPPTTVVSSHHMQPPPLMVPSHSVLRPITTYPPPPALYASDATNDFSITALSKPFVPAYATKPTATTAEQTPPPSGSAYNPDALQHPYHQPWPYDSGQSSVLSRLQQLPERVAQTTVNSAVHSDPDRSPPLPK